MFHSIFSPLLFLMLIILLIIDRVYLYKINNLMTPELDAKLQALNIGFGRVFDIRAVVIVGLLILGFVGIALKDIFAFAGVILIVLTMVGIIYLSVKLNMEKWRKLKKSKFPGEIIRLQKTRLVIGWILAVGIVLFLSLSFYH